MSIEKLLSRSLRSILVRQLRCHASAPTETIDPKTVKTVAEFEEEVVELPAESFRKGGLHEAHRRILMGQKPYDVDMERYHGSVKYKRKLLGRYGMEAAGVPAGVAWPTEEELAVAQEWERVAYPKTLQELWREKREEDEALKKRIALREKELDEKMAKVEKMKQALFAKLEKKKMELEEAKKKKDKMMEEIRRHFGYNMSTKDERFQQLLQEKEEQERKQRKLEKKKVREERKAESLRRMEEFAKEALRKMHSEQQASQASQAQAEAPTKSKDN